MKQVNDVVACIVDYGTFICVAEKLAETFNTVYYYSPYEEEYQDSRDFFQATGLEKVKKINSIFDTEIFDSIDLFIFPDIGYGEVQKYLRSIGKAVWGSLGATDLELYRDKFLEIVKNVGLPVTPYQRIVGVTNLREYLRDKKDKWIKINQFRRNMETWHHLDFQSSEATLNSLECIMGGSGKQVVFVVQDNLESEAEIGYDGWSIDGQFPSVSFQGYEKKNELYLGSLLDIGQLPDAITQVNKAFSPILSEYGYRCWWATEIRIGKDKQPYFTDPTARMPGQTGEHQTETCYNFADVIWAGANGILIEPQYKCNFAAEATLHYDAPGHDGFSILREWKALKIPKKAMQNLKLYHFFKQGEVYHFIPQGNDEIGVMLGYGNSIEEAMTDLKNNLETLKGLPIHAETKEFFDLLRSITLADKKGMFFADHIPPPDVAYEIFK